MREKKTLPFLVEALGALRKQRKTSHPSPSTPLGLESWDRREDWTAWLSEVSIFGLVRECMCVQANLNHHLATAKLYILSRVWTGGIWSVRHLRLSKGGQREAQDRAKSESKLGRYRAHCRQAGGKIDFAPPPPPPKKTLLEMFSAAVHVLCMYVRRIWGTALNKRGYI